MVSGAVGAVNSLAGGKMNIYSNEDGYGGKDDLFPVGLWISAIFFPVHCCYWASVFYEIRGVTRCIMMIVSP